MGEDHTIPIALVGCGGRGTGAASQALNTKGPTRLVAMADVFPDRLKASIDLLNQEHSAQLVPPDRQFLGMDAYKQAIDCVAPGGVVLLATPPAFRPIHVEYAVEGLPCVHGEVLCRRRPGHSPDPEGGRGGEAEEPENRRRPDEPTLQAARRGRGADPQGSYRRGHHLLRLPDALARRLHARQPGEGELAHQIRNYCNFTWLNGSFLLDWLIHNLDVCCWVKGAWPVSCQGQGGRQVRTLPDQLFDHDLVEYTFPDGTRLIAQGRHMDQCWGFFGDVIHGSKGCAVLGEGITEPKLYKGISPTPKDLIWKYRGRPAITTRPSTTCSSRRSARIRPTMRPSAAPTPPSSASWAAWPPSPARGSPGTKPCARSSSWPRASRS